MFEIVVEKTYHENGKMDEMSIGVFKVSKKKRKKKCSKRFEWLFL